MINRFPACLYFIVIFLASFGMSQAATMGSTLASQLRTASPGQEIPIIINLIDKADLSSITEHDKKLRRSKIVKALKDEADLTQAPLRALLRNRNAKRLILFWISNSIAVTVPVSLISELLNIPEIESVEMDSIMSPPQVLPATVSTPEWNITRVKAPALWGAGITGTGAVVADMDTGVDYLHPDLNPNWRGFVSGHSNDSWYNPYSDPANCCYCSNALTPLSSCLADPATCVAATACSSCELSTSKPCDFPPAPAPICSSCGHGTGTMGIMVGGSAGGTAIGIAPDAKWIAVKIFSDKRGAPISIILQGFQWLLGLPAGSAPDVVNNSWGFETAPDICETTFQQSISNLKAAGIAVVFSAGNSGPGASTSVSPANNLVSFSVGATDDTDTVAYFSSRGPSACDRGIFPHVVAPGVNIKLAYLTDEGASPNSYTYNSGTSFSAPHVAGAAALLLGAFPTLTPAQLESVFESTAIPIGTPVPNNDCGYGLIDNAAAYQLAYNSVFVPQLQNLVTYYYNTILSRRPDTDGANWWVSQMGQVFSLGISPADGAITLARMFFNSAEYLTKDKSDAAYVIDLYATFLNRVPSQSEANFWLSYLIHGLSRDVALNFFAYSIESHAYLKQVFGSSARRPEYGLVNDMYRGTFSRFPDTVGFNFWLTQMKAAQCAGASQGLFLSYQMALGFIQSPEYLARNRTDAEYTGDLYDAIFRRGATPSEISLWLNLLTAGTTRAQVLQSFINSPEFGGRVTDVVSAGCFP